MDCNQISSPRENYRLLDIEWRPNQKGCPAQSREEVRERYYKRLQLAHDHHIKHPCILGTHKWLLSKRGYTYKAADLLQCAQSA